MAEINNIRGEFKVMLAGQERTMKANFSCIEKLETQVLRRGITETLHDALNGNYKFSDVVSVIYEGLAAAKDTRLSRNEVGDAIMEDGLINFAEVYLDFLTHCLTGGKVAKGGTSGEPQAPDSL